MTTLDYTPYLHVTDDGHIWWLRQDAIRLGAGFLPVCDDNRQLESTLQAPNQRAIVNERTLIGALGDARSKIPKPLTFERDGFRYVDAAGFLEWLSQYICQTQAKIEFPNELVNQVRIALAKTAAERPPQAPHRFESLTIALEEWFDKSLSDIPDSIRQRIEKDMFPLPWDDLSPEQRRIGALQLDYQRDPATEKDRQFWWDFFLRKDALEKQITEWEKAAAPTATDLALKEAKLRELRDELSRMEQQERQPQRPYIPGQILSTHSAAETEQQALASHIAYPKAMKLLADRLDATPEELAAWLFYGPELGGLTAYLNANELNPPPRFYYGYHSGAEDYLSPLMACWFIEDDIANFQPSERYIIGKALVERWGNHPHIQAKSFITAKIQESRLADMHPTFGLTSASGLAGETSPSIESGLFSLSEVRTIEAEDFGEIHNERSNLKTTNSEPGKPAQPDKPWLIQNPDDPYPDHPWYTPARYFARELVKQDSTLLTKRELLAKKVAETLKNAGILKRGGKSPLDPATVKKAFNNVKLG